MMVADRGPRRVERQDGYLPIEDYGLIGDGATGALVGRDGSIDWLCVPRFDGQPLFCGLLDSRRGGSFRVAPSCAPPVSDTNPTPACSSPSCTRPAAASRSPTHSPWTSSLPEHIGGQRNWDYRYAWVRDAAFSVYALRRVGLTGEARGFLGWVLDTVGRSGAARVLYDLDGGLPPPEHEDGRLEGYRRSAPVRWGNAAADQTQHDAYGEILDCAYQWAAQGGDIDRPLWDQLRPLVEEARRRWRQPDHGIWEVRTPARPFTYSAAMCLVALDRGARVAARLGLPGDAHGWQADAGRISRAIRDDAWNDDRGAIVEHLDGTGGLDASLLALPLRRVIRADDPKMIATSQAIAERLHAGGGLLYRYLPAESPDGVPGDENAFLLCSFWLADNLAYQGRLDAAVELFSSLCSRSNHLGLLPEQVDPSTGAFCGNYPQGLSHVGLISTAINLNRQFARREE